MKEKIFTQFKTIKQLDHNLSLRLKILSIVNKNLKGTFNLPYQILILKTAMDVNANYNDSVMRSEYPHQYKPMGIMWRSKTKLIGTFD